MPELGSLGAARGAPSNERPYRYPSSRGIIRLERSIVPAASDADFRGLKSGGMNDACESTILMPCLNEAEILASWISKARAFIARSGCTGEVVIADNGSTDGSQAIAAVNGARVVDVAERGYGCALLAGIRTALIMGDSDDSYDFSPLDAFVEQLRAGYQLVLGKPLASSA